MAFCVNDIIYAKSTDYTGLIGRVLEIVTGKDKETDNLEDDIYVCFYEPDDWSKISLPKNSAIDCVIMAPSMLEKIF